MRATEQALHCNPSGHSSPLLTADRRVSPPARPVSRCPIPIHFCSDKLKRFNMPRPILCQRRGAVPGSQSGCARLSWEQEQVTFTATQMREVRPRLIKVIASLLRAGP